MRTRLGQAIRSTWRVLPKWSRRHLVEAATRLSPSLDDVSRDVALDRSVPKIVVGFLSSPSGLGQASRLIARALAGRGHDVLGVDLSGYFYEQGGVVDFKLPDGRSLRGPAHVIAVINSPYLPYALTWLGSGFLKERYVTGFWAWELTQVPANWRRGFPVVHDVAAPSSFVAQAIASLKSARPIRVAPYPVLLDCLLPSFHVLAQRRPDQPFTVLGALSVGSGFARKNPVAWIEAFRLAFGRRQDCRLRMLVTNAEHFAPARHAIENAIDDAPNIEVRWTIADRGEFKRWCGTPDVCLSLHRSEGFGLSLAEAMCAGYPVVATGWSGNMEFMRPHNSFPVDHRLVEVCDEHGKYPSDLGAWAEPDVEHAAGILQELEKRPDKARAVAMNAASSMQTLLSVERFCDALLETSQTESHAIGQLRPASRAPASGSPHGSATDAD